MTELLKFLFSEKTKNAIDGITRMILLILLTVVGYFNLDLKGSIERLSLNVGVMNERIEGLRVDLKRSNDIADLKRKLDSTIRSIDLRETEKKNYEEYMKAGRITSAQKVWLKELPKEIAMLEKERDKIQNQLEKLGVPFSEIQTRGR